MALAARRCHSTLVSPQLGIPTRPGSPPKLNACWIYMPRQWQGAPLKPDEFVISADEKTRIQARRRKHATQNCRPRTPMRVEHEYFRGGAWAYIAALDVHQARVFGRCEVNNGIAPFDRLVEQVMTRPPYKGCTSRFLDRGQLLCSFAEPGPYNGSGVFILGSSSYMHRCMPVG